MIRINEQIAFLRKQKGLTQENLAQALGVTNQSVSKWEAAQSCPDISLLPEIAQYFGVSIDELLGYKVVDNHQNIILQLLSSLEPLVYGEDFQLTLKLAYILHASLFSKNMSTCNLGFNSSETIEHAANAEWGFSCINLPEITTCMRMGSVFFSDNKELNLNNSQIKTICRQLETFSDYKNLKIMVALYELTIHSETNYANIPQIVEKSGIPVQIVLKCIEENLSEYISELYNATEPFYRIDGKYLHFIPLLAMFNNLC
ncbi:MAG: helix-turn-helix transcriptional regulator [Clostridia bacterium]|nr:helix-turn-helix transcriptional regulator [Clostridia bacterium]